MKKYIFLLMIICSVGLFAKSEIFDYELWAKDLKTMIELNIKKDTSLAGSDINKNLVRDDVENYIKQKYANDEFQKIMFLEAAKKIQQIITLPKNTSVRIHQKLDNQLLQIYTCRDFILFKNSDVEVEQDIQDKSEFKSRVLNTTKRIKAYIAHKQLLPNKYTIPSDQELLKQKLSCEKLYAKIKKENKKNKILSVK